MVSIVQQASSTKLITVSPDKYRSLSLSPPLHEFDSSRGVLHVSRPFTFECQNRLYISIRYTYNDTRGYVSNMYYIVHRLINKPHVAELEPTLSSQREFPSLARHLSPTEINLDQHLQIPNSHSYASS